MALNGCSVLVTVPSAFLAVATALPLMVSTPFSNDGSKAALKA
jgi:hypothetical protein